MPGHWHYMTLESIPEDQLVRPMIGPEADLTREQAHAEVQRLLDQHPALAEAARVWRAGAKDDTVFHGPFIWSIFECDQPTCQETFAAVAEEWAGILRHSGLTVDVARLPGQS